jgi:hypothetical protein
MAKIAWTFTNATQSLDFSSIVTNFSYTHGRASNLSDYSGGTATITVNNATGQAEAYFLVWGQQIKIQAGGNDLFVGWVGAVDFTDMPNTGAGSTATITVNDQMYFAGQQLAVNQVLLSEQYQIDEIGLLLTKGGVLQFDFTVPIQNTLAYNGSFATRINEIIASDRGKFFFSTGGYYQYAPLGYMKNMSTSSYTFGRTASASVIGYSSFDRNAAGSNQNFVNRAIISPNLLATQSRTSTASAALYGVMGIDIATFNTTVAVAQDIGDWVANSMDDPYSLGFQISILDIAQTSTTNLVSFLTNEKVVQLAYTPPGGVSTDIWVTAEKISVYGDYNQTSVNIVLSPLTYYNFFTLNSSVFGILDSSKLGF